MSNLPSAPGASSTSTSDNVTLVTSSAQIAQIPAAIEGGGAAAPRVRKTLSAAQMTAVAAAASNAVSAPIVVMGGGAAAPKNIAMSGGGSSSTVAFLDPALLVTNTQREELVVEAPTPLSPPPGRDFVLIGRLGLEECAAAAAEEAAAHSSSGPKESLSPSGLSFSPDIKKVPLPSDASVEQARLRDGLGEMYEVYSSSINILTYFRKRFKIVTVGDAMGKLSALKELIGSGGISKSSPVLDAYKELKTKINKQFYLCTALLTKCRAHYDWCYSILTAFDPLQQPTTVPSSGDLLTALRAIDLVAGTASSRSSPVHFAAGGGGGGGGAFVSAREVTSNISIEDEVTLGNFVPRVIEVTFDAKLIASTTKNIVREAKLAIGCNPAEAAFAADIAFAAVNKAADDTVGKKAIRAARATATQIIEAVTAEVSAARTKAAEDLKSELATLVAAVATTGSTPSIDLLVNIFLWLKKIPQSSAASSVRAIIGAMWPPVSARIAFVEGTRHVREALGAEITALPPFNVTRELSDCKAACHSEQAAKAKAKTEAEAKAKSAGGGGGWDDDPKRSRGKPKSRE